MAENQINSSVFGCPGAVPANASREGELFLSVVLLTDGRRPQRLAEALLCLVGQENADFEILVAARDADADAEEKIRRVIGDQNADLRNKTRLISVCGASEGALLNRCFEAARGRYAAILDEGVLLFDNWVEEFARLCDDAPGRVLHTYVICQEWETIPGISGECSRAVGSPSHEYCVDFDLFREAKAPICPASGIALPVSAFREWNVRFDESLGRDAAWEMRMRVAALTGVCNGDIPSAIVRVWRGEADTAREEETEEEREQIRQRLEKMPVVTTFSILRKARAREWKANHQLHSSRKEPPVPPPVKRPLFYRILRKIYRFAKRVFRRGRT